MDGLRAIARTLWIGGMWVVGIIVAPILFSALDNVTAGMVAGRLFAAIAWVGLVCGIFLLADYVLRYGARGLKQGGFWLLLGMAVLIRLLLSACEVPSVAIVPELTADYDERTAVMRFRFLFGWGGGLLVMFLAYDVFLAKGLLEYVLVHEMAHFVARDHSPRYWSVVAQLYPDYAQRRQERRVAVDHHVHRHPDQHLGQDVEELVDHGKTAGQVHVAAISPRVLEQSGQG